VGGVFGGGCGGTGERGETSIRLRFGALWFSGEVADGPAQKKNPGPVNEKQNSFPVMMSMRPEGGRGGGGKILL